VRRARPLLARFSALVRRKRKNTEIRNTLCKSLSAEPRHKMTQHGPSPTAGGKKEEGVPRPTVIANGGKSRKRFFPGKGTTSICHKGGNLVQNRFIPRASFRTRGKKGGGPVEIPGSYEGSQLPGRDGGWAAITQDECLGHWKRSPG